MSSEKDSTGMGVLRRESKEQFGAAFSNCNLHIWRSQIIAHQMGPGATPLTRIPFFEIRSCASALVIVTMAPLVQA